jgi:hypothetical protein
LSLPQSLNKTELRTSSHRLMASMRPFAVMMKASDCGEGIFERLAAEPRRWLVGRHQAGPLVACLFPYIGRILDRSGDVRLTIELIGVPYRIRTGVAAVREVQGGPYWMLSDDRIPLRSLKLCNTLSIEVQRAPSTSL